MRSAGRPLHLNGLESCGRQLLRRQRGGHPSRRVVQWREHGCRTGTGRHSHGKHRRRKPASTTQRNRNGLRCQKASRDATAAGLHRSTRTYFSQHHRSHRSTPPVQTSGHPRPAVSPRTEGLPPGDQSREHRQQAHRREHPGDPREGLRPQAHGRKGQQRLAGLGQPAEVEEALARVGRARQPAALGQDGEGQKARPRADEGCQQCRSRQQCGPPAVQQ